MRKILLLSLAAGLTSVEAQAAPSGVKLSWASHDASTTMGISWVTPVELPSTVEFGIQSVAEQMLTGPAAFELPGVGWLHEVELTGLMPDTVYKYRVGSAGDWSPEYTFRTAPANNCTPFTFAVVGDGRSQTETGPSNNWPTIHQEVFDLGPRFILNGGDLVKEGSDIDQWANWLQASEGVNPHVPMLPAIGNHDDGPGDGDSAHYNQLFFLPPNSVTGTEDYYYIVHGNLVILSLSTQTFDDFEAQADWIRQVAALHPDKWKIAYFHHPVYTTNSLLSHEPNEQGQNQHYAPAFDDANIDVIVQSHNHFYERFRPLRYDTGDVEQGVEVPNYGNGPNDGRLYVVSGGAGSFLNIAIENSFFPSEGSEVRLGSYHFIKITISGNSLHYSAIRSKISPRGGAGVIDTVTITRPGVNPCDNPMDPDGDSDGFPLSIDCDDGDPLINPGSAEQCGNSVDEDCDGTAQACPPMPMDADGDGSPVPDDCDDMNPDRFPANPEVDCDGIDNDCDCFEVCNGAQTDLCAPPQQEDGGVSEDAAAPPPDAELPRDASEPPLPADAGAGAGDAAPPGDAGDKPDVVDSESGCGCATSSPQKAPLTLVLALLGLVVWRGRRFATGLRTG